jgi:hypothetical protein
LANVLADLAQCRNSWFGQLICDGPIRRVRRRPAAPHTSPERRCCTFPIAAKKLRYRISSAAYRRIFWKCFASFMGSIQWCAILRLLGQGCPKSAGLQQLFDDEDCRRPSSAGPSARSHQGASRPRQQNAACRRPHRGLQRRGTRSVVGCRVPGIERLNSTYRTKFGFPYIVFARRQTKGSVLRDFERRAERYCDRGSELDQPNILDCSTTRCRACGVR